MAKFPVDPKTPPPRPASFRFGLTFVRRASGSMVVQKWPRRRGRRALQPITNQQAGVWDQVQELLKRIDDSEYGIAASEVVGTAWYTRDCLTAAAYGNWISWPGHGLYPFGPAVGPVPRLRSKRHERARAALLDPPRVNAIQQWRESYHGGLWRLDVTLGLPGMPVLAVWNIDPTKIETPAKRKLVVKPHGIRLWFQNEPRLIDPISGSGATWRFEVPTSQLPANGRPGWLALAQPSMAERLYWTSQRHESPNAASSVRFDAVVRDPGEVGSGMVGDPAGDPGDSSSFTMAMWGDRQDFYKMWQVPPPENESQQPAIGFAVFGDNYFVSWQYQDPTFGDPRKICSPSGRIGGQPASWDDIDPDAPGAQGPACWLVSLAPGGPLGATVRSAFVTDGGAHTVTMDTFDNGPFVFSQRPWRWGPDPVNGRNFAGCMGDLWLKTGVGLDVISPAVRAPFIDRSGPSIQPANLGDGTAGGLPTPDLYFRGNSVSDYLKNRAPGGTPWVCDYGSLSLCRDD